MKRLMLLLAFLISIGTSAFGQLVKEVTLTSETRLEAALGEDAAEVTTLKISGPLTTEDFATMKNNMAMLQVLDMSGVTDLPADPDRMQEGKWIPYNALANKLTLQQVIFPACLNGILSSAFEGCSNLLSVDFSLATQLKNISWGTFRKCSGLQSIDLSGLEQLEYIRSSAFSLCNNLKSVNLSGCTNLQSIDAEAFYSCSSLQSVNLSNCSQLTTIGSSAFWYCMELSKVTLTDCTALQTIESNAFGWCYKLSDFDFTHLTALKSIGSDAFNGTALVGEIKFASTINLLGESAFYNCDQITSVDLTNSAIAVVSASTFSDCEKLEKVDFTGCSFLNTLNKDAFSSCPALKEVVIDNGFYKSVDGVLYVVDMATLMLYPAGKTDTEFTIPSSVLTIQSSAFPYNKNLKKLTIPESVKSIQQAAFESFKDMYGPAKYIIYMNSSTPIELSADIGLEYSLIYVPKGALATYKEAAVWKDYTLIETGAEGTTVELTSAGTLAAELTGVDLGTIQDLKVTGPMNASDFEVIKQMTLLTKVDLSGTTMEENKLPDCAFSCFANDVEQLMAYLKEVILPEGITVIGNSAFSYLYQLEKVNIPTSVEEIGSEAFALCHRLSSLDVSLLTNLKSIGSNAFGGCRSISSTLQFTNTLERIGRSAFSGTNVTSVDFSNTTLNGIESYAFSDCAITSELSFPATLTSIGNGAFDTATPKSIKLKSSEMVRLGGTDVFKAAKGTTCKVYVPKGLGATYKADTYWSPFGNNIEEFGYLVTVTVNDDHGDSYGYATGGGAYEEGETVTLTASLYEYRNGLFAGWFENNQKLSGESTYSFTMGDTDRSIEARFSKDGYGIEGWSETVADPDKADGQTVMLWPYNSSLWVTGELDWNLKKFTYSRGASLLVESPITAEQINVQASMSGNQWYFISFPYDLKFSDIVLEQDHQFVVREYDGAARAANGMGASWRQLSTDATMKANKGYIIQFAQSSGFDSYNAASGMEALFNRQAVTIDLPAHTSTVPADANWNLVGNPFPCYFSVKQLFDDGLDGTVTVWSDDIQNYDYYTQDDEGVYLAPLTAFFIQHSGSTSRVTFKPEGRVAALPTTRAALAELRSDMGREVINLQLANDSLSDKTRVVFNEAASTDYELGKDAAKFSSMNNNAPSLYSLDAQNQQLAINERPVGNGLVRLGCYIGVKGSYTLSAKETLASDLYLYDTETGASCNLRETSYTFTAEAGVCNNRFELRTSLKGTGVEAIAGFSWQVVGDQLQLNGLPVGATVSLFDANGRMRFTGDATTAAAGIALPQSGIYYLIIRTAEGVSSTVSIKR
ncbi:MAG: leucine-rich repeat protein [Parabacteroides sp.]|nr:leucine-rich repeat protein [Parabacteroides sp.]